MSFKPFFKELRRRNIYKVAVTYAITGWIVMQIATSVFPALEFPQWTTQFVIILVLIGFPIALVFAWAFEITPDGLKRTSKVAVEDSLSHQTGRKLNYWIIGLLSLAVVLLLAERIWLAGTYDSPGASSSQSSDMRPSVAVLPFEDFSREGDQQWFTDGLTEEILNSLARLNELRVPARTSSFLFRNTQLPAPDIADSLNVNHLVEGSVRKSGERMVVTAQLIRARDGSHLWSNTYDATTDSVFKVQEDIAGQIASALDIYLDEEKRNRMFSFGTRNVEAYEAYLKGVEIYYQAHGQGNLNRLWNAKKWFELSSRLDSTFAAPYSQHADAYTHTLTGGIAIDGDTLTLKEAKRRMQRDWDNAIRHSDQSEVQTFYRYARELLSADWSRLPELIGQIRDNPDRREVYARRNVGWIEMMPVLGHAALSHELLQARIERDPLNPTAKWFDAVALTSLGEADKALEIEFPDAPLTPVVKSTIKSLNGSMKQARDAWSGIRPYDHPFPGYSLGMRVWVGLDTLSREEVDAFVMKEDTSRQSVLVSFAAGFPEKANRLSHAIDSEILGPVKLAMLIHQLGSHIPFSLEATPNLSRQFREANIETQPDTLLERQVLEIVQKER